MLKAERKFGVMDDWAKQGPIDVRNYSQRAEAHSAVRTKEREGVHPTVSWSSPEFMEWWEYFIWLGRVPSTFQRILDNPNGGTVFTVPERRPNWFDARFTPTVNWMPPRQPWEDLTKEEREIVVRKLWRALGHSGMESRWQDAAE
jgi:hypothetical protein